MSGSESSCPDIVLIAAMDRQHAIGREGALPWHLPADLKRFKTLTYGKPVLMGRKTAVAIGRALPGRTNWVLTRGDWPPLEGMQIVASLDAALALAVDGAAREVMVIGGGEIYALALPFATRMHLTLVDAVVGDADAFFPDFDEREWRESAREHHSADAGHAFAFDFVDVARSSGA